MNRILSPPELPFSARTLPPISSAAFFTTASPRPLPLPGVKKEEIQAIRYVATGAEIPVSTSWVHSDYPTMAFADLGEDPVLPDGVDTVIDVILKK